MADNLSRTADGALGLATLDDIRDAVRSFDTRLSALETRQGKGGGGLSGAAGKRLERLEAVVRPFFRDEFAALGDSDLPDAGTGDDTTAGAGA